MKLVKGQQVPPFRLVSLKGDTYTQENMIGKRYMLSFYRYASCPFCNLRISFLMDLSHELGLEHQMLAIFQSDEADMEKHVASLETNFPLFADVNRIYYKRFGVETSAWAYFKGALKISTLWRAYKKGFPISKAMGPKTTVPADFLIDERGIIMYAYYGNDISDHLDIDIVEVFFKGHEHQIERKPL